MPFRMMMALVLVVTAACTRQEPEPAPTPSATPSPAVTASPATSPAALPTSSPQDPSPEPSPAAAFPATLKGQDVVVIRTTRKIVALTFDAGANADAVASILATLQQEGITATFFLTGDFVDDFPAAAKSIAAAGHRMGNHTVSHPHLPALSDAQVQAQVVDGGATIRAVTGKDTRPLFRFPYGDRDARTINIVNSAGYVAVRWTVDSLGWQGTSKHTATSVAARVVDAATPGAIVLMHVGSNPDDHSILDADALPAVISGYRAKGYTFVTLDALLVGD